jgi:hypothetical protein
VGVQQFANAVVKSENQIDHQQHDRGRYAEEHDLVVAAGAIHVLVVFASEHQLLLEFQEVSFITDQSAWRERLGGSLPDLQMI